MSKIMCAGCGKWIRINDIEFQYDHLCDKCSSSINNDVSSVSSKAKKRIAYISDLHVEHYNDPWYAIEEVCQSVEFFGADWLMIAGDLANIDHCAEYLSYIAGRLKGIEILYVLGNHELYGHHIHDIHDFKNKCTCRNLHIMNRDYYHDHGDDILVVGAVGWIDGSWGDIYNTRSRYYKQRYNDFSMIKGYAKLGKEYGKADKRSIEKLLRNSATTKIVMTHFLPSPDCIEMKYMGDTLNHCYANSWGYLADSLGVDVWLYGHSHQKRSFSIGSTKFITNAIGYPSEPNSDIKVHIIEV